MNRNEPKVSGLSPMTGPPGTKITVRGENLGQSGNDIIKLTINGADCLPYLEWVSSKKIITRCTKALGSGDVVITTNSGGDGTCDVKFNCYEEIVGPTDESAVWVDEIDKTRSESVSGSAGGGESESTKSISTDQYSSEVSSTKFNPKHYLLEEFADANLNELEELGKKLRVELTARYDLEKTTTNTELVQLKANLPVIMEFLSLLENLSKMLVTSKDTSVDNIIKSINQSRAKTKQLFDPLLRQKDLCQEIEGAMHVFRQNENLFTLPTLIESSIKSRNYDTVVKEISSVLTRLQTININQHMAKKIQLDVTTKVEELKIAIEDQLYETYRCTVTERNIDEVKKLISHLNRLNQPHQYDIWRGLEQMSNSLLETLTEKYDDFLQLSLEEAQEAKSKSTSRTNRIYKHRQSIVSLDNPEPENSNIKEAPYVVQFVESAMNVFHNTFYDILALGQSYFDPKDEFACRETEDVKQTRQSEFVETMISNSISHLCTLLRYALVPDSSKLEKPSGWPQKATDAYVDWLRHVLQSIITCHVHLTKVNLPPGTRNVLEDFKEFVFELRIRSMRILFGNATEFNKNLHLQEDWSVEVNDTYGGTTKLPSIFEKNVVETLRFANEVIFKTSSSDTKSILKRVNVQASMKDLALALINSFIDSLDNALIDVSKDIPIETNQSDHLVNMDSNRVPTYSNRLLITICNCQYTEEVIFTLLQDEFEKLQGLKMDKVFEICRKKYRDYINKQSQKFCLFICKDLKSSSKRTGFQDFRLDLMIVNSQIYLVAPQLVNTLMTNIVNGIHEKVTLDSAIHRL